MNTLLTPRDAALDFIRPYVVRGDSLDSLQAFFMVAYSDYHAQIGGYVGELHNLKKISNNIIAVDFFNGKAIYPQLFSLSELFFEIKSGVSQSTLF